MDALRKSDSFLGCLQLFPRGAQDPTLPSAGSIQVNENSHDDEELRREFQASASNSCGQEAPAAQLSKKISQSGEKKKWGEDVMEKRKRRVGRKWKSGGGGVNGRGRG